MNEWQIAKETFLSIVKYFLIFIFLNNLVWAVIHLSGTSSISGETTQDGENNTQEVNYGEQNKI